MAKVRKAKGLPDGSLIADGLERLDYFDAYATVMESDEPVETITEKIFALPGWIETALRIRHYLIARPFGLRTGKFDVAPGSLKRESESVPVIARNDHEIVMGSDDKHLYFRLSVLKKTQGRGTDVFLTTAVKFHNVWGRVYFFFIRIGHVLVVRSLLKRLG